MCCDLCYLFLERQEARDGGRPPITPRRLEYSEGTIPIVEHPDDEVEEPRRLNAGNQVIPHPHRSGRTAEEVQRAEHAPVEEVRDFNSLRQRLRIKLNDNDLRMLLLE